jgi:hypothetical protein
VPVPLAVGYVRTGPGPHLPHGLLTRAITCLERFARGGGFALGEVFVDDDPRHRVGWTALLADARATRPVAVLVPDLDGTRPAPLELGRLRAQLARVTTAPLVLARPEHELARPPSAFEGVRWMP